ncbi:unnamed protein product [Ceutorhynchus assimilis]|uniref:Uncharacterized protein n=1 Tax=Ceutorhynchus assimilis TaxID=467358 RepID=A0A9N9MTC8_9CUCU|nr:unnamed protein product [Ceutorhynchus assimilis]
MAVEGTYEYECMRAELLGIDKPDYEEFVKNKAERDAAEQEALDTEIMREAQSQEEEYHQVGGKLNELNNILKSTQKKINSFAAPLSNFLKSKIGRPNPNSSNNPQVNECSQHQMASQEDPVENLGSNQPQKSSGQKISFDPTTIDNLIDKFDQAHGSMESQNKQMKRFLK